MNPAEIIPGIIPQLSLGAAALLIFAVCAAYVMLRGVARLFFGTLVLAASGWIGLWVWRTLPELWFGWFGNDPGLAGSVVPVAAFLAAFFLFRAVLRTLARPFGHDGAERRRSPAPRGIRRVGRLIFALVPTALLWLAGATVVHHLGSVGEVRAAATPSAAEAEPPPAGFLPSLKSTVAAVVPAAWLSALDPLADPQRLALAKTVAAQSAPPRAQVIDPATGEPIPRAIIVEDPELQNLARHGHFGALLRHPLLTQALEDPRVRAFLEKSDP